MYSYETELQNLKNAQINSAKADLENTRNKTLSDLESESAKNTANYATQRNTANVQNKMNAKNFQEYLASTGRANSGISAQARLTSSNNLNTQLNNINSAENSARADIERQRTNANNTYNTGLASANSTAEANYITNLLDQRYKAQQQANADREFNESVRQFNEEMALQRQQLYSNFKSGSSGSRSSSSSSDDPIWTETQTTGVKGGITPIARAIMEADPVKNNNNNTNKNKTKNSNTLSTVNKVISTIINPTGSVVNGVIKGLFK